MNCKLLYCAPSILEFRPLPQFMENIIVMNFDSSCGFSLPTEGWFSLYSKGKYKFLYFGIVTQFKLTKYI